MKKLLFILGTRPEVIKLAPIIQEAQRDPESFKTAICLTGQHPDMMASLLSFFTLSVSYEATIKGRSAHLTDLTTAALTALTPIIQHDNPDMIVVQGDTTSALTGALAGFYQQIPVVHIEAGLRSHQRYHPFPEEMNRCLISKLASYHFTPTVLATQNLRREGITAPIIEVGNTVVDALQDSLVRCQSESHPLPPILQSLTSDVSLMLVTCHRRENWGAPFRAICSALHRIATQQPITIVFSCHPNPSLQDIVKTTLSKQPNIILMPPLTYPQLIQLMQKATLVLTDSGGLQEEAPSLGKPVLVLRDVTERPEGVAAGYTTLVGTDPCRIIQAVTDQLAAPSGALSDTCNPYGDGRSAVRIIHYLRNQCVDTSGG